MEVHKLKRVKKQPRYGKYLYEYVFEVADGKIVRYLGKNKYLMIYYHSCDCYAVNKSNGKMVVPFGGVKTSTYEEIAINIGREYQPWLKRAKWYSFANFSYAQMQDLMKINEVNQDMQELRDKNRKDRIQWNRLKEDRDRILIQMQSIESRIEKRNQQLRHFQKEKGDQNA